MSEGPLIVTGSGRSGTHWLAHVLGHFVEAYHEPGHTRGDVIVDCRRVNEMPGILSRHRMMHLIRDGRDVVRSQYEASSGRKSFEAVCETWASVINVCGDLTTVRLEDLLAKQATYPSHRLSHWTEWDDDMTETFWRVCGEQMRRHGYER